MFDMMMLAITVKSISTASDNVKSVVVGFAGSVFCSISVDLGFLPPLSSPRISSFFAMTGVSLSSLNQSGSCSIG